MGFLVYFVCLVGLSCLFFGVCFGYFVCWVFGGGGFVVGCGSFICLVGFCFGGFCLSGFVCLFGGL